VAIVSIDRKRKRKPGTETTVARFELARANQEQVLAEGAVLGEKTVTVVRLALFALMGLSQSAIGRLSGEMMERDELRLWMIRGYLAFALIAFIALRVQTPNAHRARWMPVPATIIDVAFLVAMTWRTFTLKGHFTEGMFAAGAAAVLAFSVVRLSLLHVVLSTVLTSGSYVALSWLTGNFTWSQSSFVVGCFLSLGMMLGWTNHAVRFMFLDLRRRENLSRFLPRQVVDRVIESGETALLPVQREVTILFSDIRGFTTLSETLPPQQVLALLDDYFGHMTQIVMAHGGMVNKFLGDGMLACWGVPDHSDDHAEQAMRAALDMRTKLVELNAWREQHGEPPLRIGIGLHTGVVAAGMLGGTQQHEYTIIGDAVNVASRVEGLTKTLGVDILVSESTWKRGGAGFQGELIGEEQVKGRKETVVLYSLKGREPGPATVFPEAKTGS
jgi:adenylate cyclase